MENANQNKTTINAHSVAFEHVARTAAIVKDYFLEKGWEYNVIDFGIDVRYEVLFSHKHNVKIKLVITVEEDPDICKIEVHIPSDLGKLVSYRFMDEINSDHVKTLGALVYDSFRKKLVYTYQIITRHGLYKDDLDMATTESLLWAYKVCDKIEWWKKTYR